jgi:phage host-nuclease inhibitor protein Gam
VYFLKGVLFFMKLEDIKSLTREGVKNEAERKRQKAIKRSQEERNKQIKHLQEIERRKKGLHRWCMEHIVEAAKKGKSKVEVYNGNYSDEEIKSIVNPVLKQLKEFNPTLELRRVECDNFADRMSELTTETRTWWETHPYIHFTWTS